MSQQTLCTFCSFTNTDISTAKIYLLQTNWNLNQAINRYFKIIRDCHKALAYNQISQSKEILPSFIASFLSSNQEISANRTKRKILLTYGYTRNYLSASAIIDSICSFYFSETYDAWCTNYIYSKDVAQINYDATKLRISYYEVTLFSNSVVKMGEIHTFRIKILSFGNREANSSLNASLQPYIGIIKDDHDTLMQFRDDFDYWKVEDGYQLCCGGAIFRGNNKKTKYGTACGHEADIIEMKVDLIEYTLSFMINGTNYGIACHDIEASNYRLALSGVNIPAEFELF